MIIIMIIGDCADIINLYSNIITITRSSARNILLNFGGFQHLSAEFVSDSSQSPAHTVTGSVTVYQNPTTHHNSAFNMKIIGVEGGTELVLMIQTDCVKTNTRGVVSYCQA